MHNIKDLVKDKTVTFEKYQNGELWYVTTDGFRFPVPISDTGEAAFMASDKAMLFMRWIRKHFDLIESSK